MDRQLLNDVSQENMQSGAPDDERSGDDNAKISHGAITTPTAKLSHGAITTIVFAMVFLILPLSIIVAALIYIVVVYPVDSRLLHSSMPDFQAANSTQYPSVFLVDFSATQFTTFADWASTTAALLPALIMTLASFQFAKSFTSQSDPNPSIKRLPTPYQFALFLRSVNGQTLTLLDGLLYFFQKSREKMTPLLRSSLALFAGASTLGYSIWAADTWLHVTTATVQVQTFTAVDPPKNSYGFGLPEACRGIFDNKMDPAAIELPGCDSIPGVDSFGLGGTLDGYRIMNNLSASHQVLTASSNDATFSFLAPTNLNQGLDFVTSTIAVSTECTPISQKCNLTADAAFNCSQSFSGVFGEQGLPGHLPSDCEDNNYGCVAYFANANLNGTSAVSSGDGPPPVNQFGLHTNPWYIGVAAMVGSLGSPNSPLAHDPEIVVIVDTLSYFLLGCQVNVSTLDYAYMNGSVASANLTIADDDIGLLTSVFSGYGVELAQLAYSVQLATVLSNSSQEIADNYARIFSQIVLAYTALAWAPQPNAQEQTSRSLLVAQIPKAPFFVFVVLCLLFILFGLLMGVAVLNSNPKVTHAVQSRFSITGMVAALFEEPSVKSVGDTFQESLGTGLSSRVAIVKSDSGWVFITK